LANQTALESKGSGPNRQVWAIVGVLVAIAFPFFYALLRSPAGSRYIGFEYNTDDHMVYAAWMRQAMSGQFLFDNRFTTDPQPGLTIHLYFLALGWVAVALGIPLAATVGRIAFAGLFLYLIGRFIKRLDFEPGNQTLAFFFVTLGGGIGFLFWQMFGTTFTKPASDAVTGFLLNQLPIDIWQPEAFVFPSMLTNGLFMVSLCLILATYQAFLDSKESWKPAILGFIAVGLLMNIHSYDVLTVGLVMVGFLVAQLGRKQVNVGWVLRAVVIGAGAIIPALWFVHVLQNDPVFQSRAATETYSTNFRSVFVGYLPLLILGLAALGMKAKADPSESRKKLRFIGLGLFCLLTLALIALAGSHTQGYFLDMPKWLVVFAIAIAATALSSDENPAWNLIVSWAFIGMFAIYFPGLFQRKLTMGLSVPWAILASYGLWNGLGKMQPGTRRLCTVFASILVCATSLLWLIRDLSFINGNVANTTRHPVYLDSDLGEIIQTLNKTPGKKILLALPGAANPNADNDGHQILDSFASPILPDVAPIVTGLTGTYTYAGHWSETPDYLKRTGEVYRFLLATPFQSVKEVMTDEERKAFIQKTGANYALIPTEAKGLPLIDPAHLGQVVFPGKTWTLIKLGD